MSFLRRWIEKSAKEESKKNVLSYLSRTLSGDTNFKIAKYDQLTGTAKLPSGETIEVEAVGSPSKYTALQVTGKVGVVFSDSAIQTHVSGSSRKAYVALNINNEIKIRYLGGTQLFSVPVTIPEGAREVQAYFSSNCRHFMVGYWEKATTAPYYSTATYVIYSNFTCNKVSGLFNYEGIQQQTYQLNDLANGVLQCPDYGANFSEYIWFNHLPDSGAVGDFVRFFPIMTSYYNTVTNPYEWTFYPECPRSFTITDMAQNGTYTANWYLDENTLADFKSVKFSFNNDASGFPVVDIVTSFRACTAGMLLDQEHTDNQDYNTTSSIVYGFDCSKKAGDVTADTTCTNYRKNTFSYSYSYDFIGPDPLDWSATDLSLDTDIWTEGSGTESFICMDEVYGCDSNPGYTLSGTSRLYPNILLGNGGTGLPFLEVHTGDGFPLASFWYTQFYGTNWAVPILYPPDTTKYFLTTYDGVTKSARYVGNPDGLVSAPEAFAFLRLENQLAGLWCNEYYHYVLTVLGPFARDYYFAMGLMAIRNANGVPSLEFDGRPPLMERDYNTNISTFLGIDGQTGLVWSQENYPTDSIYVDPSDDVSFQAILDILRETGDDILILVADYLEQNVEVPGTVYINTKRLYWVSGSYTADPFYGYDDPYDVATDVVIAPGGTFPFENSYLKGLDSYIILGYNVEGSREVVTVYTVDPTGLTTILFKTSKALSYSGGGTILDVGTKYERLN